MERNRLLMFSSKNCEGCEAMNPLVEKLEQEQWLKIERLEVWYNNDNQKLLSKYAGFAATPFFYNEETEKKISGECDYESLKNWAKSKE